MKNDKINQDIACPIASVKPDQANDPTSVISWSVDEEAWTQIIKDNFSDYAYFF